MAYTAFEDIREVLAQKYGVNLGPDQPELYINPENKDDLKSSALRFIHNSCEELRFDAKSVAEEMAEGNLRGKSLKDNQIPLNMQMDIDRLCLEKELEAFLDTGVDRDAYSVYYCYLEMFMGAYGKSKTMIEMLSEYELNGSSVLMKHRDHYTHSVYVFALGLAIYENNAAFREAFRSAYHFENETAANHAFLRYWGLTSLFHDIGYPFELPFEQVASYFENACDDERRGKPYLSYNNMEYYTALSEDEQDHFCRMLGKRVKTTDELFAYLVNEKIGKAYDVSEGRLAQVLSIKPSQPDAFGYFMDHAYFSAIRLYKELVSTIGLAHIDSMYMDSLTAILLHNSLYKFIIRDNYRKHPEPKFDKKDHPLAFLLMLCDELQCWDRRAYGRRSRRELHPIEAAFDFSNGGIDVKYIFSYEDSPVIERYRAEHAAWEKDPSSGNEPRLKEYSDMVGEEQKFLKDIELIVNLRDIPLTIHADVPEKFVMKRNAYLSSSSFLHLYDLAVAINARRKYIGKEEKMPQNIIDSDFDKLSLEYKLLGLNRAKSFGKYLNAINCFFSDRQIDLNTLPAFTREKLDVIAPLEHERWLIDHQRMGWHESDIYEQIGRQKNYSDAEITALREQTRCHKLALDGEISHERAKEHYDCLPDFEKRKDMDAMNSLLIRLKYNDGVKIYILE